MGKGKAEQINRLELASSNNVSRLLAVETSPNCLVPVLELILGQEDSGSN